jgi:hypothetical protein
LARLDIDEAIVENARQKLGRFVLASNDTEKGSNKLGNSFQIKRENLRKDRH